MRTEKNAWPEVARRQDLWTRVVLAAAFAAMNLACPAAPPLADAGAAQRQFCVDQARAVTDLRVRCGDTLAATGEDMNASGHPGCAANARLRFDPSAASLCLSSLQASCSPVQPESCLSANTGTVALGDACFDGECASGLYCEAGSACPGQCVPLIAIGQPALGPCVEGALPWNGLCARARAVGDSCALPDGSAERPPCATGATCGPSELCVERTWAGAAEYCDEFVLGCDLGLQCRGDACQPLSGPGGRCGPTQRCQFPLRCSNSVCADAPGEAGAPCTFNRDCRAHLFCAEGSCRQRPALGRPCFVGGFQCAGELACIPLDLGEIGECRARLARATACDTREDACSIGLYCGADGCRDRKPGGLKCQDWRECQSDRCELDGRCAPACHPPPP